MSEQSPLERAARALWLTRSDKFNQWDDLDAGERAGLMYEARAVLMAVREPSMEMKLAGAPKITSQMPRIGPQADYDAAHDSWQAMIDVATSE